MAKDKSVDDLPEFASHMPDMKPGEYADGTSLHEVQFLECKITLKPDLLTSAKSFLEYAKIVKRTAKENDVECTNDGMVPRPQIREVVFFDTADFSLYNNAFILRRRIRYEDGFPMGDPEIVFKFRHPDMQKAAEIDVRPQISGKYNVKFKVEALPLKDRVGAYRLLYSHNVQFSLSEAPDGDRGATKTLTRVLPVLASMLKAKGGRVELVNQTIVEEVLQDLGTLDFGKGIDVEVQRGALARARHAPPDGGGVRLPGQVQAA